MYIFIKNMAWASCEKKEKKKKGKLFTLIYLCKHKVYACECTYVFVFHVRSYAHMCVLHVFYFFCLCKKEGVCSDFNFSQSEIGTSLHQIQSSFHFYYKSNGPVSKQQQQHKPYKQLIALTISNHLVVQTSYIHSSKQSFNVHTYLCSHSSNIGLQTHNIIIISYNTIDHNLQQHHHTLRNLHILLYLTYQSRNRLHSSSTVSPLKFSRIFF